MGHSRHGTHLLPRGSHLSIFPTPLYLRTPARARFEKENASYMQQKGGRATATGHCAGAFGRSHHTRHSGHTSKRPPRASRHVYPPPAFFFFFFFLSSLPFFLLLVVFARPRNFARSFLDIFTVFRQPSPPSQWRDVDELLVSIFPHFAHEGFFALEILCSAPQNPQISRVARWPSCVHPLAS